MIRRNFPALFCAMILALSAGILTAQTPPEKFLGHAVGADKKLADYTQIHDYFKKLASETNKMKLLTIGETTLKKPMIMAVISAPENLAKLDRYREILKKLRDPRVTAPAEAERLIKEGKPIVLITCSVHSTEIGASQASMELAYDLVTGKTPYDAEAALKDMVLLLVPSTNPDGIQMVVDWYKKYVGTQYEGGSMPWLYHPYAGHDNNRDSYMLNLAEIRTMAKVLYHDWLPLVQVDMHQQGSSGARLFIPPYKDPPLPNVHPLTWRLVNLVGTNMAFDLQREGKSGVENGRSYTAWYIGACDDTPWLHNVAGILTEAASVRMATPVQFEANEIRSDYYVKMLDFVDPWPGGWWRLRDIVEYELTLGKSLVKTAAIHGRDLLSTYYQLNKAAVEKVERNQPFAFIIPAKQHDYPTTLKMLDVLMANGVEIHQAKGAFVVNDKTYPAGSFVVRMDQPYKPFAWAMLEKQKYPDMRQYPGGPPQPPYDNAGWTLPAQMGVACEQIMEPFTAELAKLSAVPYPKVPAGNGRAAYFVLSSAVNVSYPVAIALLKDKAEVFRTKAHVTKKGTLIPAGSFLVKNTDEVKKALPALQERYHLAVLDLDEIDGIDKAPVSFPRVGIFQSWRGNADEGWTRYVFDDMGIPFKTLHKDDIKGTREKKPDLRADFDVILFASENANTIIGTTGGGSSSPRGGMGGAPTGAPAGAPTGAPTGAPAGAAAQQRTRTSTTPPEYEGGISQEGVANLRTFVEKGGILVALNQAGEFAISSFGVPARNTLSGLARTEFFCPTSVVRILVDNESPIGYGMPKSAAAMFVQSLAFNTSAPGFQWERKVVASYPEDEILVSGWLLGESHLSRKAAVVDAKYKDGRFILIGIRSQNRAQSHGTYKFLLNSLLYPKEK
ncbi:MAG: hypothetical protein JW843_01455 [Candidatus Aminicenantes bacterium]|nr:hypothetical protein [Candidatus Aminicenantes bacterium]